MYGGVVQVGVVEVVEYPHQEDVSMLSYAQWTVCLGMGGQHG